jgi:DNA-binding PadR family transcriptional regulator
MTQTLETQNLARSCNEALILAVLSRGERHGYQLALAIEEESGGYFRFNHGTLYPILHKLEKQGLIKGRWHPDSPGRKRKSYALTSRGQAHFKQQQHAWKEFFLRFTSLVEGVSP